MRTRRSGFPSGLFGSHLPDPGATPAALPVLALGPEKMLVRETLRTQKQHSFRRGFTAWVLSGIFVPVLSRVRLGPSIFPGSPLEDFDFDLGDAAGVEAEALGAAHGDVEDPAFGVGAAVGDA